MNLALFALKNLQRHPVRTAFRVVGIALVAGVMIVWSSLNGGFIDLLYDTATKLDLGEFQLRPREASGGGGGTDLYALVPDAARSTERLRGVGLAVAPRLYGFALAASGSLSAGVQVRGVDLAAEAQVTGLATHVKAGRWLQETDAKGAVVGRQLAKQLGIRPGSELILLGQAADGSIADDIVRVVGVLAAVGSDIDNRGLFIVAPLFRDFFLLPTGVHALAMRRLSPDQSFDQTESDLAGLVRSGQLPGDLKSWRDLKPLLARMLDLLSITSYFTLGFTYLALGGLILNMLFLTIYDRMREYGVMQALGMTPRQLVRLIVCEAFWLGVAAALVAWAIGLPTAYLLRRTGIDLSFVVDHFAIAGLNLRPIVFARIGPKQILAPVLFLLGLLPLLGLYPALEAASMSPVEAFRHR